MTPDAWLARHPYLQPVADLHALVDAAAAESCIPTAWIPNWDDYTGDFHDGVPLLRSARAAIDLGQSESIVTSLVERLASGPLPAKLVEESRALAAELHREPDSARRAVAWLLDGDLVSPPQAGLLHYLGWTALARYLCPVVIAFGRWRDEDRWLRNYCPTCGAPPAMAQLVGIDPGRLRLLCCGRCATRWRYLRTACPFCQNQDDQRLAVVAIEGEGGLRIDYCEACGGYLKTYNGEGSEGLLLADWTSLHLDILACDRGLKRLAVSLYEL
ncbi:MAG TPA: formate dehydrogenase accessory protein FdhE [Terriglobales bacterium]|nr:formate dehydrogenase accessory protein FdhE [Terriglobales bacterium]